jgi:hypothetical protein
MSTIIHANGAGAGRCDAKCHNAKPRTKCSCVCGGRYHAKGSSEAAQEQLTKDMLGDDWREVKTQIEANGGRFEDALQQAFEGVKP